MINLIKSIFGHKPSENKIAKAIVIKEMPASDLGK